MAYDTDDTTDLDHTAADDETDLGDVLLAVAAPHRRAEHAPPGMVDVVVTVAGTSVRRRVHEDSPTHARLTARAEAEQAHRAHARETADRLYVEDLARLAAERAKAARRARRKPAA